jgi:hypothetical protein
MKTPHITSAWSRLAMSGPLWQVAWASRSSARFRIFLRRGTRIMVVFILPLIPIVIALFVLFDLRLFRVDQERLRYY